MNKDMKIIMPVVLLLAVFGLLLGVRNFAHSYAAGDIMTSGTSGTVTWTLYNDGSLVLKPTSGNEGTLDDITNNGPWYDTDNKWHEKITSVSVEKTVHAGARLKGMFAHCTNITSIDLTGFDTSNTTDFSWMFYNSCKNLQSLDLSMFNTQNGNDFRNMFDACPVRELNIKNFNTKNSNLTNNGMRCFIRGNRLRKLVIGNNFDFHIRDAANGSTLSHGTWVRAEDNQKIAAADLVLQTATKSMAGTYTKVSNVASDMPVSYPVDYKITLNADKVGDIQSTNNNIVRVGYDVFLKDITNPGTNDYQVPGQFNFTVSDGAEDKDGNKYDLKVTVSNMHIYDLNTATYNDEGKLNWMIMYVTDSNMSFQARGFDKAASSSERREIAENAAKYDIKYEILDKQGNPVEGSYVFSAYDLDVSSVRDAGGVPDPADENKGFGDYSEGINLISGYTADTIKIHPNSFLRQKNITNGIRIYGTHGDEGTELSEFSVKVDAREFNFQWTGEYCGTATLSYYQPINVEIIKQKDSQTSLAGATLELYYAGGNLIRRWTSTETAEKFFLTTGTYVLKEISAPYGYKKASDVTFYVDTDGKIKYGDGSVTSKIVMINTEIAKSPYKILYVDKETNEEIAERVFGDPQYIGETVTTGNDKIKDIENYTYDSIVNEQLVIKENEEENTVIIYYVRKIGNVEVTYIDEDTGEEIADDEESSGKAGDNYTTIKKHIDGYTFSSDSGNTSGVYKDGTIKVVYKYKKVKPAPAIIDNINNIPDTVDTVLLYVMLSSMSLLSIILATYIIGVLFRRTKTLEY